MSTFDCSVAVDVSSSSLPPSLSSEERARLYVLMTAEFDQHRAAGQIEEWLQSQRMFGSKLRIEIAELVVINSAVRKFSK